MEIGGGKGWPSDVRVVFYHKAHGLICIGTESGALYIFGDGFQYMRPWLKESTNPVCSIVALGANKLLIAFADNSLAMMGLPTLNMIDILEGSWLTSRASDVTITFLHVDEPGERLYAYVGTSEGSFFVLDLQQPTIRLCDYSVTWAEAGLSHSMALVEIQICPKDERYIALGYDGPTVAAGAVVIYDLVKRKVYRQYPTAAITTLAWSHTGECLYAGKQQLFHKF